MVAVAELDWLAQAMATELEDLAGDPDGPWRSGEHRRVETVCLPEPEELARRLAEVSSC